MPLLAFLARADRGVVADHVRGDPGGPHLREQLQRALPPLAFLTSAQGGTVDDDVR